LHDLVDLTPVGELDFRSGCVGHNLMHQIAGNLIGV
jgi:hypothetical protein